MTVPLYIGWPWKVAGACFVWAVLYCSFGLIQSQRSHKWCSRCLGLMHCLVACALAGYSVTLRGRPPSAGLFGSRVVLDATPLENNIASMSGGYFLFNIFWCILFRADPMLCLQHVLCLILNVTTLQRGHNSREVMLTLLASQAADLMLHSRWFSRHTFLKADNRMQAITDSFTLLASTAARACFMPAYVYLYVINPKTDVIMRGLLLTVCALGVLSWGGLLVYAVRKYWQGYTPLRLGEGVDDMLVRLSKLEPKGKIMMKSGKRNESYGQVVPVAGPRSEAMGSRSDATGFRSDAMGSRHDQ